MTKHTKPRDTGHKPVHEAAAAIVALINASPRSPREEEIANIISKAMPATLGDDYGSASATCLALLQGPRAGRP